MDLSTFMVIAALISINALYVAAEFAAVSVRRSRIQQEADDGNSLAKRLLPVLSDPLELDRYVAACQIGITISSLILGAYGQAKLGFVFAPLFEGFGGLQTLAAQSASAVVVLVSLTMLQMIFGELIPKSLALEYPAKVSMWTVIPLGWSLKLYSGFIHVLNGSGHYVLKMIGVGTDRLQHIHSSEEIGLLIAESRDGGLLEPDEHRRLSQALQLGVRPVSEIMVPRSKVQALDVNSSLEAAVGAFTETPFTRMPVYEKNLDTVIGFVHARDVTLAAIASRSQFSLRAMLRPILSVPLQMTAEDLLVRMREKKGQLAIVVDSSKKTVGLVGIADVLDEFLGDVVERGKGTEPQPERLKDGRIRLPASLRLVEASLWIGAHWEGRAKTVGGKIIEELGYLPRPGEVVLIEDLQVEIERATRRMIQSVVVTPKLSRDGD
jgi:putative hemolysin